MSAMHIINEPTPDELAQFWSTFSSDSSINGCYMDTMPRDLASFLAPAASGRLRVWSLKCQDDLAGVSWIHDINCWGGKHTAWKGMYIFPEFRRTAATLEWSKRSTQASIDLGLCSLFSGIRANNENANGFAAKSGFFKAGIVQQFGWFNGELDDLMIWSRRAQDIPEALRQANLRAGHYRNQSPDLP